MQTVAGLLAAGQPRASPCPLPQFPHQQHRDDHVSSRHFVGMQGRCMVIKCFSPAAEGGEQSR